MKQITSKPINKKLLLLLLAALLSLASGSFADTTDILEQADQAYELKDYAKAREWYLKAAEQGSSRAQFRLGVLYDNGYGVTQDYAKAGEWYLKAAEQGDPDAQNNLGLLYSSGRGGTQDYAKAREWYLKAAGQGDLDAQYNLGLLYNKGSESHHRIMQRPESGISKQPEQERPGCNLTSGFCTTTDRGHTGLCKGQEISVSKQPSKGSHAQNNLGVFVRQRIGVTQDYAKAGEWYLKATEQGDPDAQLIWVLYVWIGVTQIMQSRR